jgi:hypothetical protein
MVCAKHALAAFQRPPIQRQGPGGVTQRFSATDQIADAGERLRMVRADLALTALFSTRRNSGKAAAASTNSLPLNELALTGSIYDGPMGSHGASAI